ncbi:MAG: hypothetical protein EG823_02505 [Actinobacteria bacterium]|nr:hypothetical protein [Actinomycetota bacterium]
MKLDGVPARVRVLMYVFWAGMVLAGIGVVGFFLSFNEVADPANAWIDVQTTIPWRAYGSIFAWVAGLIAMWVSRRRLDAAVKARLAEVQGAMTVDLTEVPAESADPVPASDAERIDTADPAPDGRDE